jgi:hypothetical protein
MNLCAVCPCSGTVFICIHVLTAYVRLVINLATNKYMFSCIQISYNFSLLDLRLSNYVGSSPSYIWVGGWVGGWVGEWVGVYYMCTN